jgi:3-methyladenine DNA glycosylase AlkD
MFNYAGMTLRQIQKKLKSLSTPEAKASIQKFVPDATKVYGVKMPVINELAKELKECNFELVNDFWESGFFEEKLLAAKLVGKLSKKNPQEAITLVKKFSYKIEDWAVCDTIGMHSLKPIATTYKKETFALAGQLNRSKNFWQRRLSLVLVEVYARNPELHLQIQTLIDPLKADKEYYVKKAIVWLEKSMAKHL